jgi:hypothetical protein
MFRLAEIVITGPLFALAGYTVPGGSGRTSLSCCEIELFGGAIYDYLDRAWKLGTG